MSRKPVEIICRSEDETIALGERFGLLLRAGDVVALRGDLGAGKTRFVRGIAQALGLDPSLVSSPTFVLVNVYGTLVHVDAYRLRSADDLPALGWDDLTDGSNIIVIEWAERIEEALPSARIDVSIDHASETTRLVRVRDRTARRIDLALLAPPASTQARCRTCECAIDATAPTAPFCSDRCRMADLGKWFGGQYKISRLLDQRDFDED